MTKEINRNLIGENNDIYGNMAQEDISMYENSLNVAAPSPEDIILTIERLAEDDRDAIENTFIQ